jgi:hypothetical protein
LTEHQQLPYLTVLQKMWFISLILRIDFYTKDGKLIEVKTGNVKFSKNQKQFKEDVENGIDVTPVGINAKEASFVVGQPTKIDAFELWRF